MKYLTLRLLSINIFFLSFITKAFASINDTTFTSKDYNKTFKILDSLINQNGYFKDAVFNVENFFTNKNLSESLFLNNLNYLKLIALNINNKNKLIQYRNIDSTDYLINKSVFTTLFDTLNLTIHKSIKTLHLPFCFNHSDPLGKQDITNTFVTKLLATHQGNCRSLTYLYKILADELGAKCWIALAPGHMYIKNYSEKIGWYNTELTSGTFPSDAWIMTTSYISPKAVKSGLYMDTLSNQQAIALCVLDLAHLYERETHNYYDGFILKCCDLVLQYHPVNPMALLTKAETLKKILIKEKTSKFPKPTNTAQEMEATYLKLFDLGYREMPPKMKAQKQKEEKENLKKYQQRLGKTNTP